MKLLRAALAVFLAVPIALVSIAVTAGIAAADCGGPTVEYAPTDVVRGGVLTVTGTGFGASCYDTGPPPPGEGVLGQPLTEIEISLVQGAVEQVVATGSADQDYEFTVDVIVPPTFEPGEISVSVSTGVEISAYSATPQPMTVSDAPPVESVGAEVSMFGPAVQSGIPSGSVPADSGVPDEPPGSDIVDIDGEDGDDASPWVAIGAIVIVAVLALGAWFALRRGERQSSTATVPPV